MTLTKTQTCPKCQMTHHNQRRQTCTKCLTANCERCGARHWSQTGLCKPCRLAGSTAITDPPRATVQTDPPVRDSGRYDPTSEPSETEVRTYLKRLALTDPPPGTEIREIYGNPVDGDWDIYWEIWRPRSHKTVNNGNGALWLHGPMRWSEMARRLNRL